jgi:hypothetical protein
MNLPPNPKQAYGDKKPNLALVPPALDYYAAVALGDGAIKYGAYNWRTSKVEAMTYIAAARRHLNRVADRIEFSDVEMWEKDGQTWQLGGHPELAHAIACLAILADAMSSGFLIDNRPPAGPSAGLERDLAVPKVVPVTSVFDEDVFVPDMPEGKPVEPSCYCDYDAAECERRGHRVGLRPLPEKFAHALPDLDQEYPDCTCMYNGTFGYACENQSARSCAKLRSQDKSFDVV